MENIQEDLICAVLDLPTKFELDGKEFSIYNETLGKSLILAKRLENIGVNPEGLAENAINEALTAVYDKRDEVLAYIAINTMSKKNDILSEKAIRRQMQKFEKATDEDLAEIFMACLLNLSGNKVHTIINGSGLNLDKERMKKVNNVKKGGGSLTFGGRTMYGRLLDAACERYGWTLDYVLWGISFTNLQMMLQDQISSMYLSKEEMKEAHISNDRDVINADDPRNKEMIRKMFE